MKIDSLEQAEKILQKFVPNVSKFSGDNLSLERMWIILEKLGNPHENLKIIHVAGTSGKTSTAYYIASILHSGGKTVGLTVSPHVDSITERIQINGAPISDKEFCSFFGKFIDIVSDIEINPSYFEILIAFAYWVFAKLNVDYAVIETGMGGLLDSTNVINRSDKICVITDIGLDHIHILGNTVSEITFQKAGIIHEFNQVFMYSQSSEVMDVIEPIIKNKKATLNLVPATKPMQEDLPLFQQRNLKLAFFTSQFIASRDEFILSEDDLEILKVNVPGRMDTKILSDTSILIMDGAHNGQKISTFVGSFKQRYPNKKAAVLLALKSGKEYKEVIDNLVDIVDSIIVTTFDTSQDLPAISQDPEIILQYCRTKNLEVIVAVNNDKALNILLSKKSEIKLIIGSFYLLGQIRKLF